MKQPTHSTKELPDLADSSWHLVAPKTSPFTLELWWLHLLVQCGLPIYLGMAVGQTGSSHLLSVAEKPPRKWDRLMYRDVLFVYITTCTNKCARVWAFSAAANSISLSGNNIFIFKCTASLGYSILLLGFPRCKPATTIIYLPFLHIARAFPLPASCSQGQDLYLWCDSHRTLQISLEICHKLKFILKGFTFCLKSNSLSAVLETPLGVCVTQFMTQETAYSVFQSTTFLVPDFSQTEVRSKWLFPFFSVI